MAKIRDIYEAADDFGLITSAEAKALGCTNAELVQYARRGRLERVGWGVYRIPYWPHLEAAPYAVAVKSVGTDAYLYGESVIALLGLAPTDPRRMWVATPHRVRRSLGEGFHVVHAPAVDGIAYYEGIRCQPAAAAILAAQAVLGHDRTVQAADEALRRGYVTSTERVRIEEGLEQ